MKRKHFNFDSPYLPNFIVLEERRGNLRLFPHTQQLAKLHEALDLEFRAPLSQLILRVNRISDDYRKLVRLYHAQLFCYWFNSGRADHLRLFCLPDQHRIARITIVQQITEHTPLGASHRFHFYGGPDFAPEIRMSGKRLAFSDHVLKRFMQRAENKIVEDLSAFLNTFFEEKIIGMTVNHGQALILSHSEKFLAFTYKETDTEYFLTTCLSQKEIHDLKVQIPARTFNLHYGEDFTRPRIRCWNPLAEMFKYETTWKEKKPLEPFVVPAMEKHWLSQARHIKDIAREDGVNANTRLAFLDNIPGPVMVKVLDGSPLVQFNEAEFLASRCFEDIRTQIRRNSAAFPSSWAELSEKDLTAIMDQAIAIQNDFKSSIPAKVDLSFKQ